MKLKEVFEKTVQFFKDKKIESARFEAEILISYVLKIDRIQIYLKFDQPLGDNEIQACREIVKRRVSGEPVAYITKEKGFYSLNFEVGEGVLIPRPETELVVDQALEFIKKFQSNAPLNSPRILDLGAGSGCIGFSILKNCKEAKLTSLEKSEAAFKYLVLNQEKLNLKEQSELLLTDVLSFDPVNFEYDLIVANPPYISSEDKEVEDNVKKFEPSSALFSEKNGYSDIFSWSNKYKNYLKPTGCMLFEIGYKQGDDVKNYFKNNLNFQNVEILKDLSGLDRVVKAYNTNAVESV